METRAKKSIANFKLRENQAIGAKVTLRGAAMYEFLGASSRRRCRASAIFAACRPRAFDGQGNYTLGVPDQSIFPEIELDKIQRNIGFDVSIVTSTKTNEEAKSLLAELGMPFSDRKKAA